MIPVRTVLELTPESKIPVRTVLELAPESMIRARTVLELAPESMIRVRTVLESMEFAGAASEAVVNTVIKQQMSKTS